jgi:hypothetical protein
MVEDGFVTNPASTAWLGGRGVSCRRRRQGAWWAPRSSKPVCRRELAGGFDSRPPPLPEKVRWPAALSPRPVSRRGRSGSDGAPKTASTSQVLRCSDRAGAGQVFDRGSRDWTSLQLPSSREERMSGMVRPLGRPLARRAVTLDDLRGEFLAHCEARNLSPGTLEWYADRTRRFADWCVDRKITEPSDLRWSDLQAFVLDRRRRGFAANTVHGYAQVVKTLCRLGHRLGARTVQTGSAWATALRLGHPARDPWRSDPRVRGRRVMDRVLAPFKCKEAIGTGSFPLQVGQP